MANTQAAKFSYSLEDALGVKAVETNYALLDPTIAVSAIQTAWVNQGALLDAATDAQILGGHVSIVFLPDGAWKASPTAGGECENTGIFDFSNDTTPNKFGQQLPAILAAAIVGGKIDLTNTPLKAWFDALYGAHTLYAFANSSYQKLTGLVDAFRSYRKRGDQLRAKTVEPGGGA